MSDQKPPKKKVVVTTKKKTKTTVPTKGSSTTNKAKGKTGTKAKAKASSGRAKKEKKAAKNAYRSTMIVGRQQMAIMLAGIVLIVLGLFFMSGGAMEDPNVWDENVIYSSQRLTLAPLLILLGMGLEIFAIFKTK